MHFGSTFLPRLRMMLVGIWFGLYWVLFSFFDHYYIKRIEVINFRLFRATELAFAIRPKDGVAMQGRRGGFHCYCPKSCWNNFSVVYIFKVQFSSVQFSSVQFSSVGYNVLSSIITFKVQFSPCPTKSFRRNFEQTSQTSSLGRVGMGTTSACSWPPRACVSCTHSAFAPAPHCYSTHYIMSWRGSRPQTVPGNGA